MYTPHPVVSTMHFLKTHLQVQNNEIYLVPITDFEYFKNHLNRGSQFNKKTYPNFQSLIIIKKVNHLNTTTLQTQQDNLFYRSGPYSRTSYDIS